MAKKTVLTFIIVLMLVLAHSSAWARWQQDGGNLDNYADTMYSANYPSLVFNNSTPYVAWQEYNGAATQIYVKHLDGSSWQQDGTANGGSLNYNVSKNAAIPSLAFNGSVPYVAWSEDYFTNTSLVWVKYLNGSNWQQDGGTLTVDNTFKMKSVNTSLAIYNGLRYAAWAEGNSYTAYKIYVKSNNGSGWQLKGSSLNNNAERTANYPCLAIYNDIPYVAWSEETTTNPYQIYVKHWNGSAWQSDGDSLNMDSARSATTPSLAVYNGTPYVAWIENSQLYVKYFNGSAWIQVGSGSLNIIDNGTYRASNPSLKVYNAIPYITWNESYYIGFSPLNSTYVKIWDGSSWIPEGNLLVNSGRNDYQPSLEVYNGMPYVAWVETTKMIDFYRNHQIYLKHWAPNISFVSPEYSYTGRSVSMTIYSEDYAHTPAIKLVRSGSSDIAGSATTNTAYSYTNSFNLAGASAGVYDVQITVNNCASSLKQAFLVLSLQTPVRWVVTDLGAAGSLTQTSNVGSLAIGDADQDNNQELYIANGGQSLHQLKKFTYGWNAAALPVATGLSFNAVLLADGNGDQAWEIYGALSNNHVYQYKSAVWQQSDLGTGSAAGNSLYALARADVDHDGLAEIYTAGDNGVVCQFTNTSTAINKIEIPGSPASRAYVLAFGDGNNDKEIELYSANADQKIYQYQYSGGIWQVTAVGSAPGAMYAVAVGDGDNDGSKEVYAACQDGKVYLFRWNGSGWSGQSIGVGGGAMYGLAVSDGDTDGSNEVYAACEDGHVYQYKKNGAQWDGVDLGNAQTPLCALAAGDVDNENHFEIYALGRNNHVYQFQAMPAATPTPTATTTAGGAASVPDKMLKAMPSLMNPNKGESLAVQWSQPQSGPVSITIYNLLGEKVATLVDHREYPSGQYNEVIWKGITQNSRVVGSGIYIVHIKAGNWQDKAKICVVK